MCGIVGYIGDKKAQSILLGGLRRLEYRGYDSAGVVTVNQSNVPTLLREKGKVSELEKIASKNSTNDTVGIGHTRWATHGAPSIKNAHPHRAGDIYVVHNGIIENYQDLKSLLTKQGFTFASDTDTEVLAKLIESYYRDDKDLLTAVMSALSSVVGAYGIAVMSVTEPDQLVVARKGSPLIVGLGDSETYIASDASALVGHVERVVYLNEGEVARCTRGDIELFDLSSQPLTPRIEKLELDLHTIQKKGYDHFLIKEITEQPDTLRSTLSGRILKKEGRARLGGINMSPNELREIENILIVGCGTAYYAGQLASYYIEQINEDITIQTAIASELRYRSFHMPANTVALIVSQSGETADTLACLRELRERGIKCLGIVNAVGSTIAREVDGGVYVHVGPEISVASTKAFTSQVAAMLLFGLVVAQAKGAGQQEIKDYINELAKLPDEIESLLKSNVVKTVKKLSKKYADKQHALYLGRDTLFPVALEGALKLKEISYIQSEGYAAGELKHGPIALIDDRFFEIFLLADNWLYEKSISNLVEIQARGAQVIVVTNSHKKIDATDVIAINTKLDKLLPLLMNVVLQLFAYYVAVERGSDVDQPRNLAKSVTVE
jgi:glucosamine--fructose-6-phosphate aminotransferase (isomerizing)